MSINGIPVRLHDKPYGAISPQRPELSQAGRTVLVCGGSTGIGHAIARNYCLAGASRVIVLGRRPDVLEEAVSKLKQAYSDTDVTGRTVDVSARAEAQQLWDSLEREQIAIDVLVLSAVSYPEFKPILDQGVDRLWEDYENNVHVPLYHVERFYKQPQHSGQKFVVYVSTQSIHRWETAPQMPGYPLSKSSCTCALQEIARYTPEDRMRVVSFHPSVVFTEAVRAAGYTKDTMPYTDENVPGGFSVWAASPEASFLHGRFVWVTWDVEDLASGEVRAQIDADPWLLKVGVKGL